MRVLFGRETLGRAGDEIRALGIRRSLVLSTPSQRHAAEAIRKMQGYRCATVFYGAKMHTPVFPIPREMLSSTFFAEWGRGSNMWSRGLRGILFPRQGS